MANDEWMLDQVREASVAGGDEAWPLPLWAEHRDLVKSTVADIKNTAGRNAGAITAAAFLGAFTNSYRWAHLDIAGVAWLERPRGYLSAGATGAGVRILAEFMRGWRRPKGKGPAPGPRTSLRSLPPDAPSEAGAPGSKAAPAARRKAKRAARRG
jgi:hypothetical protein